MSSKGDLKSAWWALRNYFHLTREVASAEQGETLAQGDKGRLELILNSCSTIFFNPPPSLISSY